MGGRGVTLRTTACVKPTPQLVASVGVVRTMVWKAREKEVS